MGTLSGLSIALISLSGLAIAVIVHSFDPSLSSRLRDLLSQSLFIPLIAPYKKWWAVPTLQMYYLRD